MRRDYQPGVATQMGSELGYAEAASVSQKAIAAYLARVSAPKDPACSDPNCSYRAEIEMGHYVPVAGESNEGGNQ